MKTPEHVKKLAEVVWDTLQESGRGRSAAWDRADLCIVCNCCDRRLREAVAYLRRAGRPVGFETKAPGGYYVVTDPADLSRVKKQFRKRLVAAATALKGLEQGGVGQEVLALLGEGGDPT